MLYTEYMIKAKELTITKADNGLFYLEPEWHSILVNEPLHIKDIKDVRCGWDDVEDVLKLEVEKRNTVNSLKPYVVEWVHKIITSTVEPAMLAEETEYIKQVTEFMKANHLQNKD